MKDNEMSNHQISIYIEANHAGSETCTDQGEFFSYTQNIGQLEPGVYDVKVFVNDSEKMSRKLYVSSGEIEILDKGKYVDSQGDVHIVGDTRNIATYPVKLVELDIGFIKNGQVVLHDQIFTTMAVLMPGTTSGFDMLVTDDYLKDADYFVNISSYQEETKPNKEGLRLIVESTSYGIVSGKVSNDAENIPANNVKVVCTLYDPSMMLVLDSVFNYAIPSSIEPGQSADFTIASHNKPIDSSPVANCNAESTELAIQTIQVVPEFSIATIMLVTAFVISSIFYRIRYNL
ncbi:MAG: hypothetical protein ACRD92_02600 [Nitrosopumilaceae archaeon]